MSTQRSLDIVKVWIYYKGLMDTRLARDLRYMNLQVRGSLERGPWPEEGRSILRRGAIHYRPGQPRMNRHRGWPVKP